MSPEYKNDYQKFADSAVRSRERDEGIARLRTSIFIAVLGPMAIILSRVLHFTFDQRWMAVAIVASAPLAVVLLIINYIRLPNDAKASPVAIGILLGTLVCAGATLAMANLSEPSLMKMAFPS